VTWAGSVSIAVAAVGWALVAHAVVNAVLLRKPRAGAGHVVSERVSILLPMRNESCRLEAVMASVLRQQDLGNVEVIALDDESSDGTFDLARLVAGGAATVISGTTPPAGWLGKAWACQQLAGKAEGSVLVFVDADVHLSPQAVAASVRMLRETSLDFLSPYPRQLTGCSLGLLTQPLLQWSWLTFLPLRLAESSRRPSLAAANGQFLIVDAMAYRSAGGHAGVATEVLEDMALARKLKAAGLRGGIADGSRLASCRMYDGNRDLVDGYAKSLWSAFGTSTGAVLVVLMLSALYVLPWALIAQTPWAWCAATAGPAGRIVAAVRTRGNALLALLHPLAVLCFAALVVVSLQRHRSGRTTWKGRPVP
jgi:hypothetical protein